MLRVILTFLLGVVFSIFMLIAFILFVNAFYVLVLAGLNFLGVGVEPISSKYIVTATFFLGVYLVMTKVKEK